jgi:hypothetical protein
MRTMCLVIGGLAVGLLAASAAEARCDGMGYCRPSYNQSPGQYTNGYNPGGSARVPRGYHHSDQSFESYQRRAPAPDFSNNGYMGSVGGFQPAPTLPPWNSRRY